METSISEHRHLLRSLTPSFTLSKWLQEPVGASSTQTVFYHTNMEHLPLHEENSHISVVLLDLYRFFFMSEKPFHCCSGCCHLFFSGPRNPFLFFFHITPYLCFTPPDSLPENWLLPHVFWRCPGLSFVFSLNPGYKMGMHGDAWPTGGARHSDPSGTTGPSE